MPEFVYAVRRSVDDAGQRQIELWVSETQSEAPAGYEVVSLAAYCEAWRERTGLLCAALAARAGQSSKTRNG